MKKKGILFIVPHFHYKLNLDLGWANHTKNKKFSQFFRVVLLATYYFVIFFAFGLLPILTFGRFCMFVVPFMVAGVQKKLDDFVSDNKLSSFWFPNHFHLSYTFLT